jgi:hypothetical protein
MIAAKQETSFRLQTAKGEHGDEVGRASNAAIHEKTSSQPADKAHLFRSWTASVGTAGEK